MDEKRLILAAVLSLAVIAAWQFLFPTATPPQRPVAVESVASESGEPDGLGRPDATQPTRAVAAEPTAPARQWGAAATREEIVVEGEGFRATVSNQGAELISYQLRDHVGTRGEPLEMVRGRATGPYPYAVVDPAGRPLVPDAMFVTTRPSPDRVEMRWSGDLGWIEKDFVFGPRGLVDVSVRASLSGQPWRVMVGPGIRNMSSAEEDSQYQVKHALWRAGGEVERVVVRKVTEAISVPRAGSDWFAIDDTYFVAAVFAHESIAAVTYLPALGRASDAGVVFEPLANLETLQGAERKAPRELLMLVSGTDGAVELPGFWGGKERKRLQELGRGLPESIDWGFFGLLSRPLHTGLLWIHERVVANYGWAIVLMTILIKIALLPLTHASHVSMQRMQELNPKAQAIRAKYRGKLRDKDGKFQLDNQRRMNEEMQALYKDAGVNPMGGCLPMLGQIPIFFAYFKLLPLAIELREAPWLGWVQDLSAADPYYLLPIIMGVTQFIQMKLTPTATDPLQRRIMQLFPVIFTVFSLGFPSGLVLYWLTNNIFTIFQIAVYNRIRARRPSTAG